ncbi:Tumor necrosis factor receptor superfamily member EDAR [Clarias magur]|uniref:Tumor necrosis factor receptor superfamily member EDAR n=1 Tax=Clarias magur TaxID=1594786 RepID=A0A8J4XEQ9_CLAMG|nr:Tumor necrosis factor receptor superfamily member EDAR [Clarias magur]
MHCQACSEANMEPWRWPQKPCGQGLGDDGPFLRPCARGHSLPGPALDSNL